MVQIAMKLEMTDRPGQLVAALQPISVVGGNIIAVIHQRETSETGTLSVQIVLEVPEGRADDLVRAIRDQGVNILMLDEERLQYRKSVIIIGHLLHTDLGDTVDRIDSTGFAEVAELNVIMPAITERSTALITLKSGNREDMVRALSILHDVGREKHLQIIEPLEEAA
jgi:ACT domain-containing protein